jgi:tetratricopeptide (TPR) repeat protein
MTFAALEAALDSRDDRAIDAALAALKDDPVAGVDAIDHVLATLRRRGIPQSVETRWNFRLAEALETAAATPTTPRQLAARSALRAALLQRDTLNDGEGTTRTLVLALMLGADDDESLRGAVDAAGGPEPAIALLEKGAKRSKGDDERIGRLRRALARVYELVLKDKERAFFEALKAARKLPADGLFVDDVYRLALDTRRLDEAAAFFGSLADDETLAPRARATAANKLGAVLEEKGDRPGALAAYIRSLGQHETKAARKKAERLQEQLEIATPLPPPVESAPSLPPTPTPMPPAVDDTAAHPTASPVASTVLRQPAVQPPTPAPAPAPADLALDASDIVAEEAVAPPPPPPADDDDEASVLVERGDRTVEHRDIPTMTMPPAPPPDDDDRDHDGPAWSPSSAVDDGPLPPPVAPVAVDDVPAPVTAERPVHAGFIVPPGAFDDVGHDDAQDLPPPARVPMPSPLSAEAPPATTVHAVPAAVTMTGSEPRGEVASEPASDERSGRHKKKGKPKKARRGHGTSDALEATAPSQVAPASQALPTLEQAPPASSSSSLVGETVPLVSPLASTAPPARALDFEPSIPLDRPTGADRISLGDELPEPARTTPGGGADAAPAAGVVAGVADVAAREATAPPVDEPKPARLLIPAPSPRDLVLARAQELLRLRDGDGDVVDFLTCAEELSAVIPGDPRVLRLAGRALLQSAPTGELPASGVDLVVGEAPRHGDRATAIIRDIQQALPPERRAAHTALWLAGARAAGHDVDTTHALLEEVAAGDGPDGPVFTLLDAVLKDAGDVDRRDVLHLRAWRSAERAGDVGRQIQILERRIDLLEAARRDGPALQAWTQLALEHPVPAVTRAAARRFVETKATPDERARFLARLARKLEGDEAVVVLRELLTVRVAVDDRVGAEATARDLLQRVPGDPQAVAVLAEILVAPPSSSPSCGPAPTAPGPPPTSRAPARPSSGSPAPTPRSSSPPRPPPPSSRPCASRPATTPSCSACAMSCWGSIASPRRSTCSTSSPRTRPSASPRGCGCAPPTSPAAASSASAGPASSSRRASAPTTRTAPPSTPTPSCCWNSVTPARPCRRWSASPPSSRRARPGPACTCASVVSSRSTCSATTTPSSATAPPSTATAPSCPPGRPCSPWPAAAATRTPSSRPSPASPASRPVGPAPQLS